MTHYFRCNPDEPVVETTQGRLRGFQLDDLYVFFGVPYADAGRFQAPRPVEPWEGVRDATSYGYVCPLMTEEAPNKELLVPHRYWLMNERCLNLNLWTPSLDPNAKKPVMVWLHGGAFSAGSAIEHVAYEGDHLASYGDVVVISVNHRLNVLGYLDLSAYGEKYANSANAGTADLVAALQWVHDNVARFGGDPDNVTIFGQSGGGEKVTMLMNTPAADGLFHKGIIQSGVTPLNAGGNPQNTGNKTDGRPLVRAMLDYLGLSEAEVERLETLPYARLTEAYMAVVKDVFDAGHYIGNWPAPNEWWVGEPRTVGFTEHAKTIPILIGSVMGEFCFEPGVQNKYELSEDEILPMIKEKYGEHAEKLVTLFRKAYPGKNLSDLLYLDTFFRAPTREYIRRRVADGCAPTYAYRLTYDFPIDGGKVAWHCSEIPFAFHNTDRAALYNVAGETDRLEEQICGAFVHFARYGTPGVASLPDWPPCAEGDEATMIWDTTCEVRHNFDDELLDALVESGCTPKMELISVVLPPEDGVVVVH